MAKKIKDKQFQVKFGAVSIGERAASVTITRKLRPKDPETHVGEIWRDMSKRRLSGTLYIGDDKPGQANFDDRISIAGVFDTGRPGFQDETAGLNISFDHAEIEAKDLIKLSHKTGWLVIETIGAIPPKEKPIKEKARPLTWSAELIKAIGIDDRVAAKLDKPGLKSVGELVEVFRENHKKHTLESLKLTKQQVRQIGVKLDLFFEDAEVKNPLSV